MYYLNRNRNRALRSFFDNDFLDDIFGLEKSSLGEVKSNLVETDNGYNLKIELPGMDKENIKISYEKNYLTIEAEKKDNVDKSDEKKNYVHKEIYYGSYSRSYYLDNIDQDSIKANYQDGVLTLDLTKKKIESSKKYITIK